MEENDKHQEMPQLPIAFLRWFCHPEFLEEIEGDLTEQYQDNIITHGQKQATKMLWVEVISLFRPAVIKPFGHFNFLAMTTKQWSFLLLANLLALFLIWIPFLPGTFNSFSVGASGFAQFMGFLGLVFVPIGAVWAYLEYRRFYLKKPVSNNWATGFYLAILTTFLLTCIFIFMTALITHVQGIGTGALIGVFWIAVLFKAIPAIAGLKKPNPNRFNAVPLYVLSIPIFCLIVRLSVAPAMADFSRSYAIRQTQPMIDKIEAYKLKNGMYPKSLEAIGEAIIKPNVMGIKQFEYTPVGEDYKLFFVQWVHMGATQEVVSYSKSGQHGVKGHFADYAADTPNWRYFWLD